MGRVDGKVVLITRAHDRPLSRRHRPIEVSNFVLASDGSSYSTGAEFVVDGGVTADTPRNDLP